MPAPRGGRGDHVREQRRRRPARRAAFAAPLEPRVASAATGTASSASSSTGAAKLTGALASGARNAASGRSQSPSVESATWRTPAEASAATSARRSSAAAAANRSRSRRSPRVDAQLAPGLRIDEPQLADVGELLLARVADLDGEHGVPAGERAAGRHASRAGRGSPRRPPRATRWRATSSASSSASPSEPVPAGGRSRRTSQRVEQRAPALPRRLDARRRSPKAIDAEPVAAPRRGVADRDRDALGDVGLAPVAGAERHRRRRVEHEPGDEHALGELDADVRLARSAR